MKILSLDAFEDFCKSNKPNTIVYHYLNQRDDGCVSKKEIMRFDEIIVSPMMCRIYFKNNLGIIEYDNVQKIKLHKEPGNIAEIKIIYEDINDQVFEDVFVLNCA